jgi:hypothetical protein
MSKTIYLDNKYSNWYYSIISNAKNQPRRKNNGIYYENHHIIPKSCGGSNDPKNLVILLPKEHFIVHHLLTKMMRDSKHKAKMVFALLMMCKRSLKHHDKRYLPPAKLYDRARKAHSESMKKDNPMFNDEIKNKWVNPMFNPEIVKKFRGRKRPEQSKICAENNRKNKRKPKEIRKYKCSNCGSEVIKEEFVHHESKEHYYCNSTCRNRFVASKRIKPKPKSKKNKRKNVPWNKGKTKETNKSIKKASEKISAKAKGRRAWNKGIHNPLAADNGRKGAKKLSEKVKGRKRKYLPDGSWTWEYPNKQ